MRAQSPALAWAVVVSILSGCTNPKQGTLPGAGNPDADTVEPDGAPAADDASTADVATGPRDTSVTATPDGEAPDAPAGPSPDGPLVKQNNGAACASDGDCVTGFCVDKVCCGARCGATCQACTQTRTGKPDGTCAPVTAGADPDGECPAQAPTTCGNLGGCDGAGACRLHPTTASCAAAACSGSTFTPQRHCDGRGQCAAAAPASCGLFKCNATGCPTSCFGDGDCQGVACINGTCGGKRANGASCASSGECGSGYCVDGICCGSACNGLCEACSQAKTGQADGTCQPVKTGDDPDGECSMDPESTCGRDGTCDGARACRKHGVTVMCAAATCAGSSFTPARFCDGRGTCTAGSPSSCGLARCNAAGCISPCTGNPDCVSPAICSNGACVSQKPQGAPCSGAGECSTNACVDGFCCSSGCTGLCQACSQAKTGMSDGTCAPVKSKTDPDSECAATDPTTCGDDGTCDGAGACRKHDSTAVCGQPSCMGSTAYLARYCNGQGACSPQMTRVCGANEYCSIGSCLTKIQTGQGCVGGHPEYCATGFCPDGVCCENACTIPCRACGSGGLCNTAIDRSRDVGTCEGRSWCVAGSCVPAIHWEDNAGNLVAVYNYPSNVPVGLSGSVYHYVRNGNSGIGTATSWSPTFTTSSEVTIHTNGCAGMTLAGGQECMMDIWMTPTSAGMKTVTVTAANGLGDTSTITYHYMAGP